jgi:hypothetical protein
MIKNEEIVWTILWKMEIKDKKLYVNTFEEANYAKE